MRNIFTILKKEMLYAGLSKEEFDGVENQVAEMNRKNLILWSILIGIFWFAGLIIYLLKDEYYGCRVVYTAALAFCILMLILSATLIKKHPRLLLPSIYLFDASLFAAGIGIMVCQPDIRTVLMIALVIIVPTGFLERTIVNTLIQTLGIIASAIFGKIFLVPDVYSFSIMNQILFALAGLLVGHIINESRYRRCVYATSAEKLAEIQKNYNIDLQKEVALKTERLDMMHNRMIMGLATMVEGRDNSTGGHIKRTSKAVRLLLERMCEDKAFGITKEFCSNLVKAAPMHDLGKITISDSILCKPGKFTPEEYEIMKTHAAQGARILKEILADTDDVKFREVAVNVAHYHHEHFDGTGYPCGLKGDEIPLEARIMAVADVYDALVSRRTYKESYSFEKANEIILSEMGTHFDARLQKYYELARPKLEEYYSKALDE